MAVEEFSLLDNVKKRRRWETNREIQNVHLTNRGIVAGGAPEETHNNHIREWREGVRVSNLIKHRNPNETKKGQWIGVEFALVKTRGQTK